MEATGPEHVFVSNVEDSRRWNDVELREGDIVICTPPKCGTTWTQGIVATLLSDGSSPPEERPWPDFRLGPIDEVLDALDAQTGRRFIKSHCPLGALPFDPAVSYVLVYRDPADAMVSWANHREKMRPFVMAELYASAAADGLAPLPEQIVDDHEQIFEEWARFWSPPRHLAGSLDRVHAPNVTLYHYADMYDDLATHMRGLADFLDIGVDEAVFADQVRSCELDDMRERARSRFVAREAFDGGVDSFFFRGGNGRGRELLADSMLQRVSDHASSLVPDEWSRWLASGGEPPRTQG